MTPTRLPQLGGLAVAAFGIVLLVLDAFDQALRRPPVSLVVTVTLAAAVVAYATRSLTARLRGGLRPVTPLAVARLAALGIASAVTGALVTGGWLAVFAQRLARAGEVTAARGDAVTGAVGAVSGVLLAGAGLWLQRVCRSRDGQP